MKKILVALSITLAILLMANSVGAEQYKEDFGPFYEQPQDKVWTITFNSDVAEVDNDQIYVAENRDGSNRIETSLEVEKNTVRIYPPLNRYESGGTYYLFITNKVLSTKGQTLSKEQVAGFTIAGNDGVVDDTPIDNPPENKSEQFEQRSREIQLKWVESKSVNEGKPKFNIEPSIVAPYSIGEMTTRESADGQRMYNFVRFLAGLPIARNSPTYSKEANAAALLNSVNNVLSHYPNKPAGMDEELYRLGYKGASTSNIANGYSSMRDAIQYGFMPDSSVSNRVDVGHRRWILSPYLRAVGLGHSVAADGTPYWAMKVSDSYVQQKFDPAPYEYIAWPSKDAFPISFFSGKDPWSVTLNPELYDQHQASNIVVTLSRLSDGKSWEFKNGGGDGFFNISKEDYGYTPFTLIFLPNDVSAYQENDTYQVGIEGLYTLSGERTGLQYSTTFFNLK